MKTLIDLIGGAVTFIFQLAKGAFSWLVERFMDMNPFEKGIVITTVPAFFAIIVPVARYFIFGNYVYINNPLAVSMIGIVFAMMCTFLFRGIIVVAVRCGLNAIFIVYALYLLLGNEISKAPYSVLPGYFLNLIVPVVFIALSVLSYTAYDS